MFKEEEEKKKKKNKAGCKEEVATYTMYVGEAGGSQNV